MPTKYHKNVQKGILMLGKKKKKFRGCFSDNKPIHINHPYKREVILYRPDVCLVTTHGKKYIFEVLDSQLKDENLIIADIILSCLTENVQKVYFFMSAEKDQKNTLRLIKTICINLADGGYSDLPKEVKAEVIPKEKAKSEREVFDFLNDNRIIN